MTKLFALLLTVLAFNAVADDATAPVADATEEVAEDAAAPAAN